MRLISHRASSPSPLSTPTEMQMESPDSSFQSVCPGEENFLWHPFSFPELWLQQARFSVLCHFCRWCLWESEPHIRTRKGMWGTQMHPHQSQIKKFLPERASCQETHYFTQFIRNKSIRGTLPQTIAQTPWHIKTSKSIFLGKIQGFPPSSFLLHFIIFSYLCQSSCRDTADQL